ncbi:hypothetical protein V8F33_008474 [Rhypophila sp. PSN 637]
MHQIHKSTACVHYYYPRDDEGFAWQSVIGQIQTLYWTSTYGTPTWATGKFPRILNVPPNIGIGVSTFLRKTAFFEPVIHLVFQDSRDEEPHSHSPRGTMACGSLIEVCTAIMRRKYLHVLDNDQLYLKIHQAWLKISDHVLEMADRYPLFSPHVNKPSLVKLTNNAPRRNPPSRLPPWLRRHRVDFDTLWVWRTARDSPSEKTR